MYVISCCIGSRYDGTWPIHIWSDKFVAFQIWQHSVLCLRVHTYINSSWRPRVYIRGPVNIRDLKLTITVPARSSTRESAGTVLTTDCDMRLRWIHEWIYITSTDNVIQNSITDLMKCRVNDVMAQERFLHYCLFVRRISCGYPSQRVSNAGIWLLFVVSLNKLFNSWWFMTHWHSYDVIVMTGCLHVGDGVQLYCSRLHTCVIAGKVYF